MAVNRQNRAQRRRGKIGISYSGGGPLLLMELGVAKAFVDLGVRPDVIAGASAGSLAGTAHAFDVVKGNGVDQAAVILSGITDATLRLRLHDIVWSAVWQGHDVR